jgi:hypothetical protein
MSGFSIAVDPQFESIYNLVPVPVQVVERPPMYRSRHNPLAPIHNSTLKENAPNLGVTSSKAKADPCNFLKSSAPLRRSGELKPIKKFSRKAGDKKKPSVPKATERPVMGLHTEKNFITANAVSAILAVPYVPKEAMPDYLRKDDFGRVPDYLEQVKAEIKSEEELIDSFVAMQMKEYEDAPELCDEMDAAERDVLVAKLKTKWDAVNKKYQVLTMHTVFEGHRKEAKEDYEKQMSAIEADLEKLTGHGPVMIAHV